MDIDVCRICRVDVDDLKDEGIRVHEKWFCDCVDWKRFVCDNCIASCVRLYPNGCNACNQPWKHVKVLDRYMSLHEFANWLGKEFLQLIQIYTILVPMCYLLYFHNHTLIDILHGLDKSLMTQSDYYRKGIEFAIAGTVLAIISLTVTTITIATAVWFNSVFHRLFVFRILYWFYLNFRTESVLTTHVIARRKISRKL